MEIQARHPHECTHTVVPTPNGIDYGRDLLRQHYPQHDQPHPHRPRRCRVI
jgi:hypothetical protein